MTKKEKLQKYYKIIQIKRSCGCFVLRCLCAGKLWELGSELLRRIKENNAKDFPLKDDEEKYEIR